ncbi:MAG: VCBS repeat-containing protein [Bacteroidales bacterium]|nr:VCBS repeat-containing protein [Bacteroidales bacterium]
MADLGVGLWTSPIAVDYDGDGIKDLVVGCHCVPYRGLYYFRNIGTAEKPLFDMAVRISKKASAHMFSSEYDGVPFITDKGKVFDDFWADPLNNGRSLQYFGEDFRKKVKKPRYEQWAATDWEGDGDMDFIVAIDSYQDYGWDNAYDAGGNWTAGPLHGYLYLLENIDGKYLNMGRIHAGGSAIDIYGTCSPCIADFDGDGDLDIITGEFVDGFTWFENTGTRQSPEFAAGRQLSNRDGEIRMHLAMIQPRHTDWNGDGRPDLVVGDEDGRVALMLNEGVAPDGMPQFTTPEYFRQKADFVKFGALVTPYSYDWDGDGDEDIIAGNSAGEIAFIENLTGGPSPVWAAPVLLKSGGETIRIMAGYNGSIQGPCERKWGYTVLSVADWDGDGRADLILNSITGQVQWYRNTGDLFDLDEVRNVRVEWKGKAPKPAWNWWNPEPGTLVTQWRTTPFAIDWNNDGLMDLVMMDHEGYLAYYERFTNEKGELLLHPGKRIFECINCSVYNNKNEVVNDSRGLLRLNDGVAGASGRRKICLADWDCDGMLDLIVDGVNAVLFHGILDENGKYVFEYCGPMSKTKIAGHSSCPTVADFNGDGVPELILGAEDGHIYTVKNYSAGNKK